MKKIALALLCSAALLSGCSKPADPGAAGKPVPGATKTAKDLPPPMPGAVPYKPEKPELPDPQALQKAIDAQQALQAKMEKESGKSTVTPAPETANAAEPAASAPASAASSRVIELKKR